MKQIHKEALFLTILFGNVSLSAVSGLVLDKYFKNSIEASYGYSGNLLNLNAKPIYSSSFEPFIGIKLPISQLWKYCIKTRKCVPRLRPRVNPPPREPFKPIRLQPVPVTQPRREPISSLVSNAISNAKKKQPTQRFFNTMSTTDATMLEQSINADVTAKIQSELLIYDLHNQVHLRNQVQSRTDQAVQEAVDSFYTARDAAYQELALRYKANFGRLTNQDEKYVELAAQQAIKKRHRDKRNLAILSVSGVTTSATTAIIIRSAVADAKLKIQADNDNQNLRTLPRNRFPKKILR